MAQITVQKTKLDKNSSSILNFLASLNNNVPPTKMPSKIKTEYQLI
jgi:hypothetical protein